MEDELQLFGRVVQDVRIWERIRYPIALELLAKKEITGEVGPGSVTGIEAVRRGIDLGVRNILFHNPWLASPTDLLFVGEPRRKFHDGEWWDIYCDPIHDALDMEYVHLESTWNGKHFRPARTERLRYIDLIRLSAEFGHRSGIVNVQLTSDEQQVVRDIEQHIRSEFDVDVDVAEHVSETLNTRTVAKRLFGLLLDRFRPELVVLVSSTGKENFIEACHDRGVPVAELQHGLFTPYSYMHSFPGERTKIAYPDYLLTFGDFWADVAEFPLPDDRIISVGYPYLERAVDEARGTTTKDQTVFISTIENGRELSQLAVEFMQHPDRSSDIVYKLHPNEYGVWRSLYPWLVETEIEVVEQNDSLYDLFAESRAQVGVASTALYEGLVFGLETYLARLPTVEWLTPLLESGDATLVDSVDELVSAQRESGGTPVEYERYFKPDAIANVEQVLERLKADGTVARHHEL